MNKAVLVAVSHLYPLSDITSSAINMEFVKNISRKGVDIRVIMPANSNILQKYSNNMDTVAVMKIKMNDKEVVYKIKSLLFDSITIYFIDAPDYFDRKRLYDYADDAERFAFFSRAVPEAIPFLGFKPDIIHCQDWTTAFIPYLLKVKYNSSDIYRNTKTVLTFNDLGNQGVFDKDNCVFLDMNWQTLVQYGIDYYDQINFLKAGLIYSDTVTTVSPRYASEIESEFFGRTLEDVIKSRQGKIYGILNGIDLKEYDPASDDRLSVNYGIENIAAKRENKKAVQKELGFNVDEGIPLLFLNSKLKDEKGGEIIRYTLEDIIKGNTQVVMMLPQEEGRKDDEELIYEEFFRSLTGDYEKNFSILPYDKDIACKVFAAADILMMPSICEPWGEKAMIAMRYGTIPVVRQTGGLSNMVADYDEKTGKGTGFSYRFSAIKIFLHTVRRALKVYGRKDEWEKIVKNCMQLDFGIGGQAEKYIDLYGKLDCK
ncbi:MAG: glycogen synthase [Clostridia bacterium]|nr:glycogen synthase [Clostridia bacterium]